MKRGFFPNKKISRHPGRSKWLRSACELCTLRPLRVRAGPGLRPPQAHAHAAAAALVLVGVVSRVLAGLGTVCSVILVGLIGFLCRDSVYVFNYETPLSALLRSGQQ